MEAKKVWKCLEAAIGRFNSGIDRAMLLSTGATWERNRSAAGERAIAHRLAVYLEAELHRVNLIPATIPLAVDCEYNRHGVGVKSLKVKELKQIVIEARKRKCADVDDDGFYVFSVSPDIVVHQRGTDERNMLVVELKKRSNPENPNYDALKLRLFTSPRENESGYGYVFGACVIVEDQCNPKDRCLKIVNRYHRGELQND